MTSSDNQKEILLISNSTVYGKSYLDHVEDEIRDFLGSLKKVFFIPFALYDRDAYARLARNRFAEMDYELISAHEAVNAGQALDEANAIFIGGGNTFRLLKSLYDSDLIASIQRKVAAGTPYIGSSAGSIVACPTLKTTKDMPVVEPPSFDALGIVPFQISPHYLDPDPTSTHMGETQEERINQYLEENNLPVVGLREGAFLRVGRDYSILLKGVAGARIFRKGQEPVEAFPGNDLYGLLAES